MLWQTSSERPLNSSELWGRFSEELSHTIALVLLLHLSASPNTCKKLVFSFFFLTVGNENKSLLIINLFNLLFKMGCAFSLHFTGTVCWIAACLTVHMCLMASAIWVFSIQLHMAAFQKFGKYFASCYLGILSVRKHAFINNSFLSRPENFTKFMWLLVSVSVQILGLRAGWAGRGLKVRPVPTPSLSRDTSHRPGAQSHWEDGHTQLWDAVPRPHHPLDGFLQNTPQLEELLVLACLLNYTLLI